MVSEAARQYRKQDDALVAAVQLNLETDGFNYLKWGGEQHCKAGDWLVDNQGECYTVDKESFAGTYSMVSHGVYRKTGAVWAEVATKAGTVATREGGSAYVPGDYLVYNNPDGTDVYAVAKTVFEKMYEPLPD
jgi:squalene cyclase